MSPSDGCFQSCLPEALSMLSFLNPKLLSHERLALLKRGGAGLQLLLKLRRLAHLSFEIIQGSDLNAATPVTNCSQQ